MNKGPSLKESQFPGLQPLKKKDDDDDFPSLGAAATKSSKKKVGSRVTESTYRGGAHWSSSALDRGRSSPFSFVSVRHAKEALARSKELARWFSGV